MEIINLINETKLKLIELCKTVIWERLAPVFNNHPHLQYLHFAKYGDGRERRYLSVNGIRWEDLDYFAQAIDFENSRRDSVEIMKFVQQATQTMPDFKALRNAAEEVYQTLAGLTTDGIFSTMSTMFFRLIVTKAGGVSFKAMGQEDIEFYPITKED